MIIFGKVKKLAFQWNSAGDNIAETYIASFTISKNVVGMWRLSVLNHSNSLTDHYGPFSYVDDARATAQRVLEQRIRSLIAFLPLEKAVVE